MEKESRERIGRGRGREGRGTSPRAALRRVLLLAEGRQFREAAAAVARAGAAVLAPLAAELPLDLLADSLPHSAVLIELLLNRLVELEVSPRPALPVEALAWRLAALLGGAAGAGEAARLAGAARALARYQPELPAAVDARRRQLDAAVHGLGTHGLTAAGGGDSALVSLHAALREALAAHVEAYKQALHKVQELSAVTAVSAPAASSHQRLLALPAAAVERRLIDNASLLAAVRRAPPALPALAAALDARVAADKQVLACAGLVRRADPHHKPSANDSRPVAGVLMSYSRGCATLLSLMTDGRGPPPPAPAPADADVPDSATGTPEPAPEPPRSPPDSASDGYHSDSDHSHPTPDRSGAEAGAEAGAVAGAVAAYGEAWAGAAARWLPALAALPALRRAPALPHKIVFSVVVLSFRAAISLRDKRLAEVKALLGAEEPPAATADGDGGSEGAGAEDEALARLAAAATRVLRARAHAAPLHDAERTVVTQVASTLREYAGLAESAALRALAAACCRAAWRLVLAAPQLRLDTDFTATRFDPEKHVVWVAGAGRAAAAGGARGEPIRSFVWPALLDRQRVLFRAVVLV